MNGMYTYRSLGREHIQKFHGEDQATQINQRCLESPPSELLQVRRIKSPETNGMRERGWEHEELDRYQVEGYEKAVGMRGGKDE